LLTSAHSRILKAKLLLSREYAEVKHLMLQKQISGCFGVFCVNVISRSSTCFSEEKELNSQGQASSRKRMQNAPRDKDNKSN